MPNGVDPFGLDDVADHRPWYDNDWTDWINPAAMIAAHGASLGDRIGEGFSQGNRIELIVRNARARQEGHVNRIANASSCPSGDISGRTRAEEQGGILGRGLLDAADSAIKTADAVVASGELAAEVAGVVAGGAGVLRPRKPPFVPNRGPTHGHHSDPTFMGGAKKQPLTTMGVRQHQQLHNDLNDFLRQKTDAFGNHMRPQRGNPGSRIRDNFTRQERLDAVAEFYSQNRTKYPDAARDFFKQHPGLE